MSYESELRQEFKQLISLGVLKHNGQYRGGEKVYVLTPTTEWSEEAKRYMGKANTLTKLKALVLRLT